MRRVFHRRGLLQKIGSHVFSTAGEAIRADVERAEADLGRNPDWQRVDEAQAPLQSGGPP
jgi:hypothetical protein